MSGHIAGDIRVGTSGWHYPGGAGTWNGPFYPKPRPRGFDELRFYAERFSTVEINATFYRPPEAGTTRGWVERTPDGWAEVKLGDAWVWDMFRQSRFVSTVRILTRNDVNVEELRPEELPPLDR